MEQGTLQEAWRSEIHSQWARLLRASLDQQRGWSRVNPIGLDQRIEDQLDGHVKELGG